MRLPSGFTLSIMAFFVGIGAATPQTLPPKKESELLAAGYKPMSSAQIASLFVGNTEIEIALAKVGNVPPGGVAKTFYRDARVRITVPQGGPRKGQKLESNWWMEGDLMCGERTVTGQGHSCRSLYQVGSSHYSCGEPGGNCNVEGRIVPGNPDKI